MTSLRERDRAARLARLEAEAPALEKWRRRNRSYYRELQRLFRLHVPPGRRVLHVGCGLGDLLAAVEPRRGLGIDLSPSIISKARERHAAPGVEFRELDPESFELDERFDVVLIDSALADMGDIQACLECVRRVCEPHTRLVMSYYSALWGPLLRLGSRIGLRRKTGEQNWLGPEDFQNLLTLAGFDQVCRAAETLLPVRIPMLSWLCNRLLAKVWPLRYLCLTQMVIARPMMPPADASRLTCTVVIPTRNERGNIAGAIARLPQLGAQTEVIFVDGHSTDGTPAEVERVIAANPERMIRLMHQSGRTGKGQAVRQGFEAARGDVLMILDADLTVPPEDLPRFLRPLADGTAEFINGTRLVYPMEREAMRFLNRLGNRFFSLLLSWILGQRLRDTLCGTKALLRSSYGTIAANRHTFGDFDPFGDFDLIFGAAKANLKFLEVPVRYRARSYGETNISRFSHGWLLLRMSWIAFRRLKMR
jgi:SAM-dependent methyltransferase